MCKDKIEKLGINRKEIWSIEKRNWKLYPPIARENQPVLRTL